MKCNYRKCEPYLRKLSPSMRREWIEMKLVTVPGMETPLSPSMRREWIEIGH